jgi:hypothetical protein
LDLHAITHHERREDKLLLAKTPIAHQERREEVDQELLLVKTAKVPFHSGV